MPSMELRLERLIDAVQVISNIDDLSDSSPVVLRHPDPTSDRTVTIVCSVVEPTEMVLPMNAVWIVFDKESQFYKQALRRTSKAPSTGFKHSWELLYFYERVFDEQYYDPDDVAGIPTDPVGPATVDTAGIFALSVESLTPTSPIIISEGHHSLTDDRPPKAHSHSPRRAEALAYGTGQNVVIADQNAPAIGMALVCDGSSMQWRRLTEADLNMGGL